MVKARPRFNFNGETVTPITPAGASSTVEADVRDPLEKTQTSRRAASREGKRGVTFYLPPAAWRQLKLLSVQRERPVQDLMVEAVDMLFAHHGHHRLARDE